MRWVLFQGCGQSRGHQTHISHQLPWLQDPSAGSWASAHTMLFPLCSLPCCAVPSVPFLPGKCLFTLRG